MKVVSGAVGRCDGHSEPTWIFPGVDIGGRIHWRNDRHQNQILHETAHRQRVERSGPFVDGDRR